MAGAGSWYGQARVVREYESARTERLFVRGWRSVLRALAAGLIPKPPLSSLFDHLYLKRLLSNAQETFRAPNILDIGCGTSYVYRHLLSEGWSGRCSGIDASKAMIDTGTTEIASLRDSVEPRIACIGPLFSYQDRLGRLTLSDRRPVLDLDRDSVEWLRAHRSVATIEDGLGDTCSGITAFSGPLCFFPPGDQFQLLRRMLAMATEIVTIQFKNSAYSPYDGGDQAGPMAAAIDAILGGRVRYPRATLATWWSGQSRFGNCNEVEERHESGDFSFWRVSRRRVEEAFTQEGWIVTGRTTMGLLSQAFYPLVADRYLVAEGSKAARLLADAEAVDDFLCEEALIGDNLQISAVRQAGSLSRNEPIRVTRGESFRHGYRAR